MRLRYLRIAIRIYRATWTALIAFWMIVLADRYLSRLQVERDLAKAASEFWSVAPW